MTSNTGCTSDGELAITFNISAVAACCSRASFNSLFEAVERLDRVADIAGRLVLAGALRPLAERSLRFVAALLFLLPFFDDRAISALRGQVAILAGLTFILEGATARTSAQKEPGTRSVRDGPYHFSGNRCCRRFIGDYAN
jgi:hypothetical protein